VATFKTLIRALALPLAFALTVLFLLARFVPVARDGPVEGVSDLLPSLVLLLVIGFLAGYLSWQCLGALNMVHRFQHTLAALRDAVLVTDDEGRVCFLNGPAQSLTGWHNDALRQPIANVLNLLDPVSREPLASPVDRLRHSGNLALPTGKALLRRRDGTEKSVEHEVEPLPACGSGHGGVVVILRDVGERLRVEQEARLAEDEAHALLACAPVAMVQLDRHGRCVWTNPACQALVGFSAEEALGNGWVESLAPEDREVAGEWESAVRRGEPYVRDCRFQDEQGRIHWLRLCSTPVRSARGEFGHAGVLEDVTRQKQLEHQLAEQKQAQEALRRSHQEQERQAGARLAAVEKNHGLLQERLADRQRAEEEQRREHGRKQTEWQQTEQKLRQEIAELGRSAQQVREQLRRAEEELARLRADNQDASKQVVEKLRQEIAELNRRQETAREQLAQRKQAEEELRREYTQKQSEWQRNESRLRKEIAELIEMGKVLDAELAERRQREDRLWQEQQDLLAAKQLLEEELQRQQEVCRSTEAELRAVQAGHQRAADERARRHLELAGQEQALKRVAFLGGASRALGASLDPEAIRKEIPRLAVPFLAEVCLVHLARAGGLPFPATVVSGDDGKTLHEWSVEDRGGQPGPGSAEVGRVIESAKSVLLTALSENWQRELADTLAWTGHRPWTPGSLLCVPLLIDGIAWGAVSFVRGTSATPYGAEEQAVAGEFVRRAAAALACALRYQEVCRHRDELDRRVQELTERLQREEASRQRRPVEVESNGVHEDLWERLASGCRPALARLRAAVREVKQEDAEPVPVTAVACETQRLSLLFEKFWAAARLKHGRLLLVLRPVELEAVVKQAVASADLLLRERRQHLVVSLPLLPEWLEADGERLAWALAALLESAGKRTPPGGTVRLTAERRLDRLFLRIQDGGDRGLCAAGRQGSVEEADTGLALVREVVELHQGKWSVGAGQEGCELVLEFAALAEQTPERMDRQAPVCS
jgi:PAS domain S-box-containing protein